MQRGITIDDLKFHQCVRLPKFDKERSNNIIIIITLLLLLYFEISI